MINVSNILDVECVDLHERDLGSIVDIEIKVRRSRMCQFVLYKVLSISLCKHIMTE